MPTIPTPSASAAERVALLDRYMRIRTLSRSFGSETVAAVQAFWRGLGLELVPLSPEDGAGTPALYVEIAGTRPGPTVLLYGHYDVQPPGDLAAWSWAGQPCDPWSPRLFLDGREVAAAARRR